MNPPHDPTNRISIFADGLGRLLLLCVLVGAVAGLGAIGFYWLLELSKHIFFDLLAGYRPPGPAGETPLFAESSTPFRRWALFMLPAVGGLASGWIVYRFAPETAGHGTDAAIDSYHFREGAIRARVPFIKTIASAITIGTGGSAGREGPIAQIGAGFGSILAARLNLSAGERRTLMSAGMAAGIGAIFHAPLAGALFAAEVLYREMDLEHEVIVPAFISSIIAYSIFAVKFGWNPIFQTPNFVFQKPSQLIPYVGLAFVVAGGAMVYTRFFYFIHRRFENLKVPNYLKPAIGGLVVGFIGLFVRDSMGAGYGVLQQAFNGEVGIGLLLAVAVAKIATTAFSVGSGGSGGVFGPAIVIGGALGGVVGLVAEQILPAMEIDPGAFVIVGMAGFFAAAANCPISTLIMVSEMTGNYHLLVPAMLVCVLAYLLATNFTLYEKQLPSRLDSPSKMGNMLTAVLEKLSVRSALSASGAEDPAKRLVTVAEGMALSEIIEHFSNCDQTCFPTVDGEGKLRGMVDGRDIRRVLGEDHVAELIVARDLAKEPIVLTLDDNLLAAVKKMTLTDSSELIIVDEKDPSTPLATLSHDNITRAYDDTLFTAQP